MELTFKSVEQIANEYLLHLKSLKPEINDRQEDSSWYIKANVIGGVVSGAYSDTRKIADDAFPQSSRHEAIEKHLFVYFNEGFKQATPSEGFALVTGLTGTLIPNGTQFIYEPNNNQYNSILDKTITDLTGVQVPILSQDVGQSQNLLEGALLKLTNPPAGADDTATVYPDPMAGGRDEETDAEAVERILIRLREPPRGGTANDYEVWAKEADDSVTEAKVLRFPNGLGTVGVVITSGTTDIDGAIDNGDPISFMPSQATIQRVKDYIYEKKQVTDCATVLAPIETTQDVTVLVKFNQGGLNTILGGQTLTQKELVEREVTRALYKTPIGGHILGLSGYVVGSRIEESIDVKLSIADLAIGSAPILLDRQVQDLSLTGYNRLILSNEYVIPGVINILEF